MKRKLFIGLLMIILFMITNQTAAQESKAASVGIENKIGRITWLFADRAESSVLFYIAFKDLYDNDDELYEYNLDDPNEVEQLFIEMFKILYDGFFDCYYNPDEEQRVVMGFVEDDQITEFQIYILSTGFAIDSDFIRFVFIHNTVDDKQALFCNIDN